MNRNGIEWFDKRACSCHGSFVKVRTNKVASRLGYTTVKLGILSHFTEYVVTEYGIMRIGRANYVCVAES